MKVMNEGMKDHIHDFLSYNEAFADDRIRKAFLRRILILVFSQFLFFSSCLLIAFCNLNRIEEWITRNYWIFWTTWITCFVFMFAVALLPIIRKTFPWNAITLCIFTLLQAITTTFAAVHFQMMVALSALGLLTLATFILILLTCQEIISSNLQVQLGFILLFLVFSTLGLIISTQMSLLQILESTGCACLYLILLTLDTQMVLGGKKEVKSPDEHILATLNMYLDFCFLVIHLFK